MSESTNDPKFQLLSNGQESTVMPVADWYELQDKGKVKVIKDFSNSQFGVFEDDTGQAFRIDFRRQAEGIVHTTDERLEFANIVAITPKEKAELIK